MTGASGLFGRPLVRRLIDSGAEVFAVARFSDPDVRAELERVGAACVGWDLRNPDLDELPAHVDHVFHAGAYLPVRTSDDAHRDQVDQRTVFDANVQATGRLLARYRDAASFFYCSSARVYDASGPAPLDEGRPVGARGAMADYALSKIACEQLLEFLSCEHGARVVIARMFALYGPLGGYPTRLARRILAGLEVAIQPARPVYQTVIYEDDYVDKAVALTAHAASPPLVVNFAGSDDTTIEGYCATAARLAGRPVRFVDDPGAPTSRRADVSRLEQLVGPTRVGIADGLGAVIAALREQES